MKALAVLLLAVFLPSCKQPSRRPAPPTPAKAVRDKQYSEYYGPVLVAEDGTVCNVGKARFNGARVGDSIRCRWMDP